MGCCGACRAGAVHTPVAGRAGVRQAAENHDSHVRAMVVPGSQQVSQQAVKEGLDKIFIAAGAQFRMPGCSMCIGMNDDKVPPGARCMSTSNRNFIGRQGPDSITHLASPLTVAASAIAGCIASPEDI